MKTSSLSGIIALAMLACSVGLGWADDVSLGATHDPASGREEHFMVSESVVRAAPAWTPGKKRLPLEMSEAIEQARRQGERDHAGKLGDLRSVLFMKRGTKYGDVWAYSVNFRLAGDPTFGASYVVLLDGTVVSPNREAR
ncbi:MAG: hypothetical protein BGO12_18355 [Verrucomicrobia bacterium 61-8]|nr:hypothetical protein [Verrucomicrobiota bacterium]OJU99708.1 MAG: hypothetical protein BGO12_18355 [Verrucomicrobia bacterium 61-8]